MTVLEDFLLYNKHELRLFNPHPLRSPADIITARREICLKGGLPPRGSASRGVCLQGGLPPGGLSPRGSASRGVCLQGGLSASKGVCLQGGLSPRGSASRGVRLQGVCLQGEGVCTGGGRQTPSSTPPGCVYSGRGGGGELGILLESFLVPFNFMIFNSTSPAPSSTRRILDRSPVECMAADSVDFFAQFKQ